MQDVLFVASWALMAVAMLLVSRLIATGLRERSTPELYIAGFFSGGIVAYACLLVMRTRFVTAPEAVATLESVAAGFFVLPPVCLILFTRKVFRADATWAFWFATTLVALTVAQNFSTVIGVPLLGVPEAWVEPGSAVYWIGALVKAVGFCWASVEALLYWSMARRRVGLGLSTPMLANRFLLWGLWSGAATVLLLVRVLLPIVVARETMNTDPPMLAVLLQLSAAIVCATAVWLTFSPPRFYQRWVEGASSAA